MGSGGGDDDVEGCDRAAATFLTIDSLGSRPRAGARWGMDLSRLMYPGTLDTGTFHQPTSIC